MDMMDRIKEDSIVECLSSKIATVLTRQPLLYENLTRKIIGISYEVMNELGIGFAESVYHHSLEIALRQNGFHIQAEVPLQVSFRGVNVGNFKADLIVDQKILLEIKATDQIIGEHKAQVINYLCASD
jgi:GxxExxY protein